MLGQAILLFALNFMDAVLTIYWVRNGFAEEGNLLMAGLLDIGNLPFLLVKLSVGGIAAIVLWRWRNLRLARIGLPLTLSIYVTLMGVHLITGLSAFGILSDSLLNRVAIWTGSVFALLA